MLLVVLSGGFTLWDFEMRGDWLWGQSINSDGRSLPARRSSLAEREYAEPQRICLPSLLVYRDHPSKVTVGAAEALFETADSLDLTGTMADYACEAIRLRIATDHFWPYLTSSNTSQSPRIGVHEELAPHLPGSR